MKKKNAGKTNQTLMRAITYTDGGAGWEERMEVGQCSRGKGKASSSLPLCGFDF